MNTEHVLARAAESAGFRRVRYRSADIPASFGSLSLLAVFGDDRGMYQLGSYLFPLLSSVIYPSKYTVVCSYPGFESLFPGANEYWALTDRPDDLFGQAFGLMNRSPRYVEIVRSLNYWFESLLTQERLSEIYDGRILTTSALERSAGLIPVAFPEIPPLQSLRSPLAEEIDRRKGRRVFVRPKRFLRYRLGDRDEITPVPKEFWVYVLTRLLESGFAPVIARGGRFVDLSRDLPDCVHVETSDELLMMATARECGLVVDFGGEDSRFAQTARTPYVSLTERKVFDAHGLHELDDLAGFDFPRRYFLGAFPVVSTEGQATWELSVVKPLLYNLKLIDSYSLPAISRDLKSRNYGVVRKKLSTKLGTRFIKVEKV